MPAKPKTDMEKCNHCDVCIRRCPIGSINPDDPSDIIINYCHMLSSILIFELNNRNREGGSSNQEKRFLLWTFCLEV